MDVKVSIIVPTLNVVKFVDECISSIIVQDFKELEILVIDAGSDDGTNERILKYVELDDRIRLITSEKKSYGYQINLGIREAKGKYVAIVEADDFIESGSLKVLYDKIEENNVDILKGDFNIFVSDAEGRYLYKKMKMYKEKEMYYDRVLTCREFPWLLKTDRYLWKGLYRRDFLKENDIKLNETAGAAFQDSGFLYQTLISAKSIMYVRDTFYCYRKDNEGSSVYSPKGMKYIAEEFSFIKEYIDKIDEECKNVYLNNFYFTLIQMTVTRYKMFFLSDNYTEPQKECVNIVREMLKEGIENGLACKEGYSENYDLYMRLYVYDYDLFKKTMQYVIEGYRRKFSELMNFIEDREKVIAWGSGEYGKFLEMILAKKKINFQLSDIDKEKVKKSHGNIVDAREYAKLYVSNENVVFIICSKDYKYEIRNELTDVWHIPNDRIMFYEMGTMQFLLKL